MYKEINFSTKYLRISVLFATFATETSRIVLLNTEEYMTEIHRKYRLTSMEEPTDEMLQELMEDVAAEAR